MSALPSGQMQLASCARSGCGAETALRCGVCLAALLRRVDDAFAAARGDALAPPATLLSVAVPALLAFFDTRSVLPLRASCTEARAAVAAQPWEDPETHITGPVVAWRACFPAARTAALAERRHIDADFEHLRGIHTL